MTGKNYTLNLDPIFKALERDICSAKDHQASEEEAREILAIFKVIAEITAQDAKAAEKIYIQLGLCVTVNMVKRFASEKIAADLIKRIKGP